MSVIGEVFRRCKAERRTAFIPYLTAGDPSPRGASLVDANAASEPSKVPAKPVMGRTMSG